MELELVVANGTVVDGTGRPAFRADVGVRDGRVAAFARPGAAPLAGRIRIDAAGLVVAPGFVDLDSHADWALAEREPEARLLPLLRQGVTTVVGGACGFSPAPALPGREDALDASARFLHDGASPRRFASFGAYLDAVAADGLLLNAGFLLGHNTLRAQLAGAPRPATAAEVAAMQACAREALAAGALGLSFNLAFVPGAFAAREELDALLRPAADAGALVAVHARAYGRVSFGYGPGRPHNVRAVEEVAALARDAGVRAHVYHLVTAGRRSWRTGREVLAAVDRAVAAGVDLSFDAAPYSVVVGPLQLAFAPAYAARFEAGDRRATAGLRLAALLQPVLLGMGFDDVRLRGAAGDAALAPLEGLSFAAIAGRLRTDPLGAQLHVARRVGMGGASVLVGAMSGSGFDDAPLRAVLRHDRCAFATNAAPTRTGPQNPSATGAFPRVLGRYARDLGLFGLEEAVRRMTSFPAQRAGLVDTGVVAEGAFADLTLFDPETVADDDAPESPGARPRGIRMVLVSGRPVLRDGELVPGVRPGRLLRRAPAPAPGAVAAVTP